MLRRCIFCRSEFRPNEVLEHFGGAREVAYDPERGRLWAICEGCGRWTLAPFESRWEALEELERSLDSFRALAKTENVSLFQSHHLQVVRIGRASLREEAWWRFGQRLVRRRFVNLGFAVGVGAAAAATPAAAFGVAAIPFMLYAAPYLGVLSAAAPEILKTARFGWTGWRSPVVCLRCGHEHDSLSYRDMSRLRVVRGKRAGELGVRLDCREYHKLGLQLNDGEAELLVRRYLARRNMFGARTRRVHSAADLLQSAATSFALVARYTPRARPTHKGRAHGNSGS